MRRCASQGRRPLKARALVPLGHPLRTATITSCAWEGKYWTEAFACSPCFGPDTARTKMIRTEGKKKMWPTKSLGLSNDLPASRPRECHLEPGVWSGRPDRREEAWQPFLGVWLEEGFAGRRGWGWLSVLCGVHRHCSVQRRNQTRKNDARICLCALCSTLLRQTRGLMFYPLHALRVALPRAAATRSRSARKKERQ